MKSKRFFSIIVDFFTVIFIGLGIFFMVVEFFNITNRLFYNILELVWLTSLFCIKDLPFREGSLGKRICKLELLTITNEKPTVLVKILRNLTIYLWPIELVLIIVLNKRLGDIIFKTKVVEKM